MKERYPTILDVARAAGVSTATVSRAMNGRVVSPAARAKVEEAVERLGYRPNSVARGLATGRSGVIGVIVPDVAGPLYAQMARGIEDVTEPLGLQFFLLTDNRSAELERQALRTLLERQVDGVILIGSRLPADELEELVGTRTGAVLVEREAPLDPFTSISLDNEGGAYAATEHLIERGHRRIAHVTGLRKAGERRLSGYLRALEDAGLPSGPLIDGDFTEASGVVAAQGLRALPDVTAVFCANDRIALGLVSALLAEGWRLPDELSIIGFDDLPFSAYLSPSLTTVRQDARAMGRLAAQRVVAAMSGSAEPSAALVPTSLVVRASVAPGPAAARAREDAPPKATSAVQVSRRKP
jgi:LacI family transcriptional regulator